jgi:hypothetical protein
MEPGMADDGSTDITILNLYPEGLDKLGIPLACDTLE